MAGKLTVTWFAVRGTRQYDVAAVNAELDVPVLYVGGDSAHRPVELVGLLVPARAP